jgi:hypothetical protein
MNPDPNKNRIALGILENLAGEGPLFDTHVHPFNIADPVPSYTELGPSQAGVFGQGSGSYEAPVLELSRMEDDTDSGNRIRNKDLLRKFNLLNSRSLYKFTGPRVLKDHMALAGISHAFLLPVALPGEHGDLQMAEMARLFSGQEGFSLGYSVPNEYKGAEIIKQVGLVKERFNISVLKIQTAITGIDPFSSKGLERLHLILEASRVHELPLVVHGGYSEEFAPAESVNFGCLDRLQRVDWKVTEQPVVIAHAGFYGCSRDEIEDARFPQISALLSENDHLLVDIAGLAPWALEVVMERIDQERILFGSDALYNPPWKVAVNALKAMMRTGRDAEKIFHQIACVNPIKCFNMRGK